MMVFPFVAPVITDMKEAAKWVALVSLKWKRRYRLMATLGVRNLSGYKP